ncbi:esterase-like activity of phytase family protein [Fulvivirga maritima]|uniref:esterase-like activity of phytase family protein n=1 Tax=Fulvivirga maritima TaxID=2904247 RepID=UPI001F163355|nr:esterase-like activity of phytase family protein [Fulvivirga maritima]UII28281.1 esterase-like activity of phytase family protein [Fulvivirga maritima]
MKKTLFTLILCSSLHFFGFAQQESISIKSYHWALENDSRISQDPDIFNRLSNDSIKYKGGLLLSYDRSKFGGLSSLSAAEDGLSLLAISDYSGKPIDKIPLKYRSKWYKMNLQYKNGLLDSAKIADQGQVFDLDGEVIDGGIESIAESDNMIYLSFDERAEMLGFNKKSNFKTVEKTLTLSKFPDRDNAGIECITLTKNHELFAIYEFNHKKRFCEAWMVNPKDNATRHIKYYKTQTEVKGATTLHNGDIIVMEKTWNENDNTSHVQLMYIFADDLKKSKIKPTLIYDAKSAVLDNFEGITSFYAQGKEHLLLISDDNGDSGRDQRTLLLHFELDLTF